MSKEPNRNVYVGHRYVPKIMGEWDKSIDYEGLSIVTHQGASYTSKKRVPVGIDIKNEEFWVITGNYDAQVEYYRLETDRVAKDLLLKSDQTYVDTELDKKANQTYVNTELGKKSDKTYVDTELGKKSDKTYVDTELDKKSDKTYVDTELDKKSNITYVDTELGKKSDKTYVDTELGKKSNQTYVDTELDKKSDQTYVDGELVKDRNSIKENENDLNDRSYNGKRFGLYLDGRNESVKFQEFVDYCFENNLKAYLSGEILIDKQITILCDFDFTHLDLKASHEGVALMIGKELSNANENGTGHLPKVTKIGNQWGDSVGVLLKNLNRWTIHATKVISGFGSGLKLTAQNYGTAYNNIHWASIMNNKINIELYATKTGWVNENKFFGGSASHTVDKGMQLEDVHVLKIHMSDDSPYLPDNNVFFSPSFEGSVPYYPIYIHGYQNMIYSGRYEASGGYKYRVLIEGRPNAQSISNALIMGYGVNSLEFIEGDNTSSNIRHSTATLQASSRGDVPSLRLKNTFADYSNIVEIGGSHSDDNIVMTADKIELKTPGDTNPRLRIRTTGAISTSDGTGEMVQKVSRSDYGIRLDDGLTIANSNWDTNTIRMGYYHLWVSSAGKLRIKHGAPESDDDGSLVGV